MLHVPPEVYMCHLKAICATSMLHVPPEGYMCHLKATSVTRKLYVPPECYMCQLKSTCVTWRLHVPLSKPYMPPKPFSKLHDLSPQYLAITKLHANSDCNLSYSAERR